MLALANKLSLASGLEQFDVVEIFLISLTATVSFKGAAPQPKTIHFKDEPLVVKLERDGELAEKEILIKRRVIDLNFLTSSINSRGRRESLEVRFRDTFTSNIEVIQAAQEKHFESFLCVLDAEILYELYRAHGARMLEKNVRSFLGLPVRCEYGIKTTLREEPEKFIAYNNGVTITAEKAELFQYKEDLSRVAHGYANSKWWSDYRDHHFAKREGIDISQVKVMAKINVAKTGNRENLTN